MKYKTRNITLLLFCLALLIMPRLANSSPFFPTNQGQIYGHKGPDGAISFFVNYHANNWKTEFHKVILPDNKYYNFLYVELANQDFAKKPVPSVFLTLNEQDLQLQPLTGTKPSLSEKTFRGWFALSEELVRTLGKTPSMTLNLKFDEKMILKWTPFSSGSIGFKQLPSFERSSYIREGQVLDSSQEPESAFFYPQLFIPNVKPEEVFDALIYNTNFKTYKPNDEFDYSSGYFIRRTSDPQAIQLLCRQFFDSASDLVTVTCRPYKNGVWVTLGLMRQTYSSGRGWHKGRYYGGGSTSYSPYEFASSFALFVNPLDYWRTTSQLWAGKLHTVYSELYGKLDYGFSIEWRDTKRGPFKITKVDTKRFPELSAINPGDLLIKIDDTPTNLLGMLDFDLWLDNGFGGSRTFTFKSLTGEEKKITISSQYQPVNVEKRKNYKKIIAEKMPDWFVKKEIVKLESDSEFLESDIYQPLGKESIK